MKEKLKEYALFAEIVSAVCIVLSLLFVGMQIRMGAEETAENSEAIRGQVRESMLNADMDMLRFTGEYPYILSPIFSDGDYTPEMLGRITVYSYMLIRTRENYWKQRQHGLLDNDTYNSYLASLIFALKNNESASAAWDNLVSRGELTPGFYDEINVVLKTRS